MTANAVPARRAPHRLALATGGAAIPVLLAAWLAVTPTAANGGGPAPAAAAASPAPAAASFDHEHAAWTAVLRPHVRGGTVDYSGIKASAQPALSAYLSTLQAVTPAQYQGWTRDQKLAFWLNAYNAHVIKRIVDAMPTRSIMSLDGGNGAAFKKAFVPVKAGGSSPISLDHLENEIVRKQFKDARIHFALNCAAVSCPPLRAEAWRASALNAQLDESTRAFVRNPQRNAFDAGARKLRLSKLFEWFAGDFQAAAGSVPAFVARYADPSQAAAIQASGVKVEYFEYDWALNGR